MAETMVTACPECKTKIRVPESAIGKKIRCKACEKVFPVSVPKKQPAPEKQAIKKPAEGKKPEKQPEAPMKLADEEEVNDDDGKAYNMGVTDDTIRCPQCAAEMDGPDAVLCLECGFNTKTRTLAEKRRIKDTTGEDKFFWMLPAILCTLGIIVLLTYWCIHHFVLPSEIWGADWDVLAESNKRAKVIGDESITGWYCLFFHPAFEMPLLFIFLLMSWKMGRFAFHRFVTQTTPPEVELK